MQKALEKIKHGERVIECLTPGRLFFVNDIQKATGLDDKSLRLVLGQMLRHGHIEKNTKGQWFVNLD